MRSSPIREHFFFDFLPIIAAGFMLVLFSWNILSSIEEMNEQEISTLTYHNHSFLRAKKGVGDDSMMIKHIPIQELKGSYAINFQTASDDIWINTEEKIHVEPEDGYAKAFCYYNQTKDEMKLFSTVQTYMYNGTAEEGKHIFENVSGLYVVNFTDNYLTYLKHLEQKGWCDNPEQIYYNWSWIDMEIGVTIKHNSSGTE